MKVRDLIHLLESNGWKLKAVRGSHRQFKHPNKGMVVTVAGQTGKDVPNRNTKSDLEVGGSGGEEVKYTVIYEQGPSSWGAYVPDLPGVISVGETRSEVEQLIHEAVEFHLDGMREEGLLIPAPSNFAGELEVKV